VICLLLLVLAFLRYVDQRVKSTNQAYWFVITLEGNREGDKTGWCRPSVDAVTHAGGVAFKTAGKDVTYLLVEAKDSPGTWVLPKGHIRLGEKMRETAVREVREESGVWAAVRGEPLDTIQYTAKGEAVRARFFLMEALREEKPSERRGHVWLPLDRAVDRAKHDQTRELLKLAEKARAAL
jgi:ADP-ribose pyrophosphatase YjhB (NUDIX family)